MLFERLDTWLLLWFVLFLVGGFLIDRCLTIKQLRQELKAMKKKEREAWLACERLRREKKHMAVRKEAAVDYTVARWKEEVEALNREIEKKDRLLNQKWREVMSNVQN